MESKDKWIFSILIDKILNILYILYKLNKLNYIKKFIINICYNKL